MRHIEKLPEPEKFAEWKASYPNVIYKDLGHDRLYPGAQEARWSLRSALLEEQKGLCCYCEVRIEDDSFHIEHFKPKEADKFPELQLVYTNLHASCRKNAIGGPDESCSHKKANFFSLLLISPLEPDCESHFQYDVMGEIIGIDERGRETVSMLNLNSSLLKRSRKNLIEYFEKLADEDYEIEISKHLDPLAIPLGEFYTAIKYLYSQGILH